MKNGPLAAFWMPFTANRATKLFYACCDTGLSIRATGNIIALSPPLVLDKTHMDKIFGKVGTLLEAIG